MQVPTAVAPREGGIAYKWLVMIVIIFGLFMSILDATIVNIAIPRLQSAFGANLNSVQWVITGYTLAQGVATPLTAFLSDRFGIKRFYIISLAAFTIGSICCGLSWSLSVLIFFRIVQGLGGAFLFPLSITMLYREFPPQERGVATGMLGIPILVAPALGPTLGGYIVTFASWQLIFFINVPVGIVGILMTLLLLREYHSAVHVRFDAAGFVLSAAGLGSLLYAFSDASTDGWGSGRVLGFLIGGLIFLALFVVVELSIANRGGQPLLDLRIFSNSAFAAANIAAVFITFTLFGGFFLVPLYLQVLRGQSAFQAGLLLLPQSFAAMVGVVLGGRLVDRFGVRSVVFPGVICIALGTWLLTSISLTTPFPMLQFRLVLLGLGVGLSLQPLTVAALSSIRPRELAQASSINTVVRFISQSLGVAVLATLVQNQTKIHFSHLAEQVTASSPLGQLLPRLQALFVGHGASLASAQSAAMQAIAGLIQERGYVLALQDAFRFSLVLTIVAFVCALFIRSRSRPQAAPAPIETAPAEREEAPAEALLEV